MSELELKSALAQPIDTFCDAAILAAGVAKLAPRNPRRFLMRLPQRLVVLLAVFLSVSFGLWPELRALERRARALRTRGSEKSPAAGHSACNSALARPAGD